jgi:hypothetical protein
MKKMLPLSVVLLFILACSFIKPAWSFDTTVQPTATAQPQVTTIVEFPDRPLTSTVVPHIKPILVDDKMDAFTFFQIIKTQFLAGDNQSIAEKVKYPIKISLNGHETAIKTAADFEKNFKNIFNDKVSKALLDADENSLLITANGVSIGKGEIWFNQFCFDTVCAKGEFLITQINN